MTHADMLKGLLAKKKGTQANREATAQQRKTMLELGKQLKQSQNNAPTTVVMKNAARGG
jgi:hypothetical protein